MEDAEPNKGHLALARLVEIGKCSAIITQNVDNLHQNSGIPDDKVIELHGNASYATCLSCHTRYELAELEQQFNNLSLVEPCTRCGGIIKTATISFGQAMPEDEMRRAQQEIEACDMYSARLIPDRVSSRWISRVCETPWRDTRHRQS